MLSHIVTDLHEHYVTEVLEPQIGNKKPMKPSSTSPSSIAKTEDDITKQARQLVYDVRYRARREDIPLEKAYTQHIGNSSASAKVKEIAKEKLFGRSGVSVTTTPVKENYVKEEKQETKFQVRVTDKSSGKTYVRMATRTKINQLRANPNIASVEMTKYGKPYEGEAKKGKLTAKVTSGKGIDHDGDGKIESSSKEHAGVVHNAIQRAKGGVPDGKDTRKKYKKSHGLDEGFSNWREDLYEIVDEIDDQKQKQIKEKKVNNTIIINPPLNLESFVKNLGGELIDITEKNISDYDVTDIFSELNEREISLLSDRFIDEIIEEVFYECIEEGYEIYEIQETLIESIDINVDILNEAKVTYGHDTKVKSDKLQKVKSGIKRVGKALARGAGYVAGAAVRGAKAAGKEFSAGYDSGKKSSSNIKSKSSTSSSTSSRSTRKKSKTSEPSLLSNIGTKLKKGLKKVVSKTARSVSRGARNVARSMEDDKSKSTSTNSTKSQKTPDPWKDDDTVKSKKTTTTKPKPKKSSSKLDDLISSIRNESKVYEAIVDQPTPADDQVRDKQSDTVKRQQLSNMKKIQQKREQLAKQTLRLQQQNKMPLHSDSYEPEGDLVDEATAAAKRGLREPHRSETLKSSGAREAGELMKTPQGKRELKRRIDYRRQKQTPEAQAKKKERDAESERISNLNRRPMTTKQRAMSAAVRASGSLGT
jgi:hypothetical protein